MLTVLWAINCVEPNPDFASICCNVDGIAVYDTGYPGSGIILRFTGSAIDRDFFA